ncbi:MAG: gamma carbonic anhydrase family protein [Pseudomonadales bacterium]|nr:gamma carbonic anhydrase family protein [Pseudomonadales bacterium]
MIFSLGDKQLTLLGEEHFIAETASVVGAVQLGNLSSIWFNAVLRAEHESITIGTQSNVQDGAVLHVDPGYPLVIGDNVTIGHKAMVHGCSIGDYSLIGINAVVLNGARIGRHCIIGANALVTENMVIPDGSMVLGSPGKIRRELDTDEKGALEKASLTYVNNLRLYHRELRKHV